jgi:hypothetical protein
MANSLCVLLHWYDCVLHYGFLQCNYICIGVELDFGCSNGIGSCVVSSWLDCVSSLLCLDVTITYAKNMNVPQPNSTPLVMEFDSPPLFVA